MGHPATLGEYHDFAAPAKFRDQQFIMRTLTLLFFVAIVLVSASVQAHAQHLLPAGQTAAPAHRQDIYQIQLDPKTAESLLVHREPPACQKDEDGIKVMGTVVVAITIDKDGKVSHARTISGPRILRPLALAAARKYLYRPYLLNKRPVEVETEISVKMDCIFHNGQA
jgi:hypothetical protein